MLSFSSFSCAVFLLPPCQVTCTGGRAADDKPTFSKYFQSQLIADRPLPIGVYNNWMQITSTLYLSCIVVPNINTSTANMHDAHTWYASEKSRKANASAGVYNLRSDPAAHKSTPPSPAFHTIGKPGRGSYQGQIKLTLSVYQQNSYHQPFLGRVDEDPQVKLVKRLWYSFSTIIPPIQVCFAHIWEIKKLLSVRAVLFPHLGPHCGF